MHFPVFFLISVSLKYAIKMFASLSVTKYICENS